MIEIAIILAVFTLALAVWIFWHKRKGSKAKQVEAADSERLSNISDPLKRARIQRRMDQRQARKR